MQKIVNILKNNKTIWSNRILFFFIFWFVIFLILSFFRDSIVDENIYIGDSVQIANLLKEGKWIGNYGVGLHGFLSKLLVGIIFVFTGPSVLVPTVINVVFSVFTGVIFFRILKRSFNFREGFSLLGVSLLFCNFQFFTYTPTFYRDIQALFFVLLTVLFVLEKKNKWLIGLILLFILDSKEYIFFVISPAIVGWVGIESYFRNKGKLFLLIKDFILNSLKIFLPSFVFLILMFTTSLIPLNIYNANILSLIEGGNDSFTSNFDIDFATYNRDYQNNENVRLMPEINIPDGAGFILSFVIYFINTSLSYLGKILYPRTFSFISIPFLILIPALITSVKSFRQYIKEKRDENILILLIIYFFVFIYIIHASTSRYILPIVPFIIIYWLSFLQGKMYSKVSTRRIILLTILFVLGGLFFEYSYIPIKVVISAFVVILYFLILKFDFTIFKIAAVILLALFTAGTSVLASYKNGQIGSYISYGYNRETKEIISLTRSQEKIWINNIGNDRLPFIYRRESLGNPEWRWELKEWVPKKQLLKVEGSLRTYNFSWSNEEYLEEKVKQEGINTMVFIKCLGLDREDNLLLENQLDILLDATWLKLQKKVDMKNKTVYIFTVID